MQKINFTKAVASGNDFVVLEFAGLRVRELNRLAKKICNRKYGIGADGLLVLEKSKIADIRMRIFNTDGSEAEMCGNGARCAALYISRQSSVVSRQSSVVSRQSSVVSRQSSAVSRQRKIKIGTMAGIIEAQVNGDNVKIKLTGPKDIKLDIPIKVNKRNLAVNFINTGVPHTVVFVQGLDKIDVFNLGREIRYNKEFAPAGANVDFVEVLSSDSIALRTYERGVEGETLACGTGAVASALLYAVRCTPYANRRINIRTKGGDILKVYFNRIGDKFRNIWLAGEAKIVYTGVFNV